MNITQEVLEKIIEEKLPKLVKAVKEKADVVVLHQDSFAGDYQKEEFELLGMAIKYIGIYGKEIRIHGRNRQTITKDS